ncbi:MAG TPA: hypothetical protein VGR81_11825 [Candidatus Acidoferrales bacterium]|nr:hypothetical protein [Candidatus Acidoferrales bacterium]
MAADSKTPAMHCLHSRTILIAKDEHEEYFECLDCGEIFDPAEQQSPSEAGMSANFDESLSDA